MILNKFSMRFKYIYILFLSTIFIIVSCSQKQDNYKILVVNMSSLDREGILNLVQNIEKGNPKIVTIVALFKRKDNDDSFYKSLLSYKNVLFCFDVDSMLDIKEHDSIYPYLDNSYYGALKTRITETNDKIEINKYYSIDTIKFKNIAYLTCYKYDSIKTFNSSLIDNENIYIDKKLLNLDSIRIANWKEFVKDEKRVNLNNYIVFISDFDSFVETKEIDESNFYLFSILNIISNILDVRYR